MIPSLMIPSLMIPSLMIPQNMLRSNMTLWDFSPSRDPKYNCCRLFDDDIKAEFYYCNEDGDDCHACGDPTEIGPQNLV